MWYKIENKTTLIYISDTLITVNPELSTDLCAPILIELLGISYWDLQTVLRNNNTLQINKLLSTFKHVKRPTHIENKDASVVGCLLQKTGRKNITNTYFIYESNTLFVSKQVENHFERCRIMKDTVLQGEYLLPKLAQFINKKDYKGFESLFINSIQSVFERFATADINVIKAEAIDCIAKNTIITNAGFDFFDIEYAPSLMLTKSHFLFRSAMGFNKQYIKRKYWSYKSPYALYLIFCDYFGVKPNVEQDIISEINFRKNILTAEAKGLSVKELRNGFYNTTPLTLKVLRYLKAKIA